MKQTHILPHSPPGTVQSRPLFFCNPLQLSVPADNTYSASSRRLFFPHNSPLVPALRPAIFFFVCQLASISEETVLRADAHNVLGHLKLGRNDILIAVLVGLVQVIARKENAATSGLPEQVLTLENVILPIGLEFSVTAKGVSALILDVEEVPLKIAIDQSVLTEGIPLGSHRFYLFRHLLAVSALSFEEPEFLFHGLANRHSAAAVHFVAGPGSHKQIATLSGTAHHPVALVHDAIGRQLDLLCKSHHLSCAVIQ